MIYKIKIKENNFMCLLIQIELRNKLKFLSLCVKDFPFPKWAYFLHLINWPDFALGSFGMLRFRHTFFFECLLNAAFDVNVVLHNSHFETSKIICINFFIWGYKNCILFQLFVDIAPNLIEITLILSYNFPGIFSESKHDREITSIY